MQKINKLKYIFALVLAFCMTGIVNAQWSDPNTPGEGPEGDGSLRSPIDMYVIWLAAVAIIFIVFFAKKALNKTKQSV